MYPNFIYRIFFAWSHIGPGYSEQKYSLVVTGCFRIVKPTTTTKHELVTTHDTTGKQYSGIMFSIEAKVEGVKIQSFTTETLAYREMNVRAFTLKTEGGINGTEDFLKDSNKWVRVSKDDGTRANFTKSRAPSDVFIHPTAIHKGSSQSFFILGDAKILCKKVRHNKVPVGSTHKSDGNIRVSVGIGKNRFSGRNFRSCVLNGSVVYSVEGEEVRM